MMNPREIGFELELIAQADGACTSVKSRCLGMSKTPRKAPVAQALARHKAAQAPIDAHFGQIDDEALANQLFTAERNALKALAETPCASDAEFVEKVAIPTRS